MSGEVSLTPELARRLREMVANLERATCPAWHEHDGGGCYDCDCNLTPASLGYNEHRAARSDA